MNNDKMLLVIALAIQTCTACAPKGHSPQLQVSGFETQIQAFELASQQTGHSIVITDLIIEFNANISSQGENGVCLQTTNTTPRIEIDSNFWATASDQGKEALVFHELGHCILHRSHTAAVVAGTVPASIMFPCAAVYNSSVTIISATCNGIQTDPYDDELFYDQNRDQYINELFSNGDL